MAGVHRQPSEGRGKCKIVYGPLSWRFSSRALALCLATTALAQKKTRVTIGATETMETHNPYGDSVALLYGIYTELAGPLCKYNWSNGSWEPRLAKSWKVLDPNNWVFELDQRYTFNDGSPVTAHDIVHSIWRIFNDPQSKQKASVARPVKEAKALGDFSVQITTHKPTAPLLDFLCDGLIITSKAAYDKHGPAEADRKHHLGGGPYELVELVQGQRMVIRKRPDHPAMSRNPDAPDEVVFRVMREAEQRVAALLNNEVQVAQLIPPHMMKTVENSPNHKIVKIQSLVIMFLGMQPKPPFDKKEVRQAVCYAIDRDKIIKTLLQGQAQRLDGPLGPGQLGYNPNLKARYTYDPKKARELLTKAGHLGVEVELQTPVGRYILDKQVTEAMIPMLNAAGFKAKLADAGVAHPLGQRPEGQGAVLLHGSLRRSRSEPRRSTSTSERAARRGSASPIPTSTRPLTRNNRSSIRRNGTSTSPKPWS